VHRPEGRRGDERHARHDRTGDCEAPGGHGFVPIDKADDGWRDEGDRVRLPKGVCKKLREGARLGFVGGTTCAQKTPSVPVCHGTASASSDGGTDSDAGAPERLVEANGPSGLTVFSDRLYYAAQDGLFYVPNGQAARRLPGSPTAVLGPWFVAQNGPNVVANGFRRS
jgi:hypothetical protein